jgi:predicted enzyme related to lactoylglutathione lyase
MAEIDVRGRFVWHQLLTADVPAARSFYSRLVNWKAQAWPLDPNYIVCQAGDVPTAGMMPFTSEVRAGTPSHWLQYIGTRDVDATAQAAVRGGGAIIKEPGDMKGAGRYAVLQDPQGAVFAIIDPENARPEPPGMPPPHGQFSWHELATTDHEAAFAFYSSLFGWDAMQRMDIGPMGVYLIFGYKGEQKGGIYIKPPDMPAPPHWLPYVQVANVDASVPVVEESGGKVVQPPMDVPGGSRVTVIMDPAGAAFALHSYPGVSNAEPGPASTPEVNPKPRRKAAASVKPKSRAGVKARSKARPKARSKASRKASPKGKTRAKTRKAKAPVRKNAPKKSMPGKTRNLGRKKVARRKK